MVCIALRAGTSGIILSTAYNFEYTGVVAQRRLVHSFVAGQALCRNGIAGQARVIATSALSPRNEKFLTTYFTLLTIIFQTFDTIIYFTTCGNAFLAYCVEPCITGGASVFIGAFSALLMQ